MALIDELEKVNTVITFMERVSNLEGHGLIPSTMVEVMLQTSIAYLETIFPPPPA